MADRLDTPLERGDRLVREILRGGDKSGCRANELVSTILGGYPPENLKKLFQSDRDDIVGTGVWIASELGPLASVLLDCFPVWLDHPCRRVRFYALDCVMNCATPEHAPLIAKAVGCLEDSDSSVRWKCAFFLSQASSEQLGAALRYLQKVGGAEAHERGLTLVISSAANIEEKVITYIDSKSTLNRMYGAIACTRIAPASMQLLSKCLATEDNDVREFVIDFSERKELALP